MFLYEGKKYFKLEGEIDLNFKDGSLLKFYFFL